MASRVGSFGQRSDGVSQARVYAGLDPVSGKQRYTAATIHAKSEAAAKRELRKLERKVLSGRAEDLLQASHSTDLRAAQVVE